MEQSESKLKFASDDGDKKLSHFDDDAVIQSLNKSSDHIRHTFYLVKDLYFDERIMYSTLNKILHYTL